eukprot:scaffold5605_cov128-Cylindrotheca_fusiformis.AAC.28
MDTSVACFNGEASLEMNQKQYEMALSDPTVRSIKVVGHNSDKDEATQDMLLRLLSLHDRKWISVKLCSCLGALDALVEAIMKSRTRKLVLVDVSPSAISALGNFLSTNPSLLILEMKKMQLTADSIHALFKGLQHSSVMEMMFDQSSFLGDSHVALCQGLAASQEIQHLSLKGCGLNDEQCAEINGSLEGHESLLELNLEGNSCVSAGMDSLSRVLEKTDILVLDLSAQLYDNVQSLDLLKFSRALASSRLRYLQLSDNQITDDNMRALAGGLQRNKTLRILNLAWCNISASAMSSIATALCCNESIRNLNLFGCSIDDQAMSNFASCLLGMHGLKRMDLGGQQDYTEAGITELLLQMEHNVNLEEVLFNSLTSDTNRFYLDANRGGRKFLRSMDTAPTGLWPLILKRANTMSLPKCSDPWTTDLSRCSMPGTDLGTGFNESEDVRRASVLFHLLRNGLLPEK